MKTQYRIILEIFIVIMIIIALGYCNKRAFNPTPTIIDAKINEQIAKENYNKASNKVKIIEKERVVYKQRYKTLYDTIYKDAPDTCRYYLSKLNDEYMANDSINDLVIESYGNLINAGLIYQSKKDSVILKQDAIIDSLTHSKKKYWKGFKRGFIAGAIVTEALNVGAKFVK